MGGFPSTSSGMGGFPASSSISVVSSSLSSSASSVSSSGSSSASSSSSSGGILELCDNQSDDDGDGLIDCADPDCVAFECVPPVPAGWSQPASLWEGPGNATPPSCSQSGGYDNLLSQANDGLVVPGANCPSCSCSGPQGVACQVAAASFFNNGTCAGGAGSLNIAQGICQGFVTTAFDPQSVRWTSATPGGGVCVPQPSGPAVIPPLEWADQAQTCGVQSIGGGCGGGVCVPSPTSPFSASVCIQRSGDFACPAGYPIRELYFAGANDSRSCSNCGCGSPTGLSCVGTMQLYSDQGCSQDEVTLSSVSQCSPLAPDPTPPPPPYQSLRSILYTGGYSGSGSCNVVSSNASGNATPSQPITFCCLP